MRVVLESPFGVNPNQFIPYARAAVADSLSRGEAPMAMHLVYTQPGVLDDTVREERERGMAAAFAWYSAAERCVVYRDFGISSGMQAGIDVASRLGMPIDYRSIWPTVRPSARIYDPFPAMAMRTFEPGVGWVDANPAIPYTP